MIAAVEIAERSFRDAMRLHRKAAGYSQQKLCQLLAGRGIELDTSAVTRLENGQRVIRLGEALHIADILGFGIMDAPVDNRAKIISGRIRELCTELEQLSTFLAGEPSPTGV